VVTSDEVALIRLRSGLLTLKLDRVVVRLPRVFVTSARLGWDIASPLTIMFDDGGSWLLEVPPPNRRHARAVLRALAG
jgi:hypothetical protein